MQRSVIRAEEELNEEERQRQIDDEHWFLDIPELAQKELSFFSHALLCVSCVYFGMVY